MKKTLIGVSAGLALCLSSYAFAKGDVYAPTDNPYTKTGFEVGIDAGWADYSMAGYGILGDEDTNNFAAGAHIGYNWELTNHPNLQFGAEFGYKYLGTLSDYGQGYLAVPGVDGAYLDHLRQHVLDLLLTAKYYVYQGFNLFGKAGVANVLQQTKYKGTVHSSSDSWSSSEDIWGLRPEVALGAGYTFYKHLDVHVMYDHIASDADSTSIVGSNTVLAGLSFVF